MNNWLDRLSSSFLGGGVYRNMSLFFSGGAPGVGCLCNRGHGGKDVELFWSLPCWSSYKSSCWSESQISKFFEWHSAIRLKMGLLKINETEHIF